MRQHRATVLGIGLFGERGPRGLRRRFDEVRVRHAGVHPDRLRRI
jgi:hypothetical protein